MKEDVSDEICSKIQLRKRFHYQEIINAGTIKPRDGVLRLINELSICNIEQYIVTTSGLDSLEPFLHASLKSYLNCLQRILCFDFRNRLLFSCY